MLVLEFPLRSPMNKLSKAHRALWVFQLNIHGSSAPDPLSGGVLQLEGKMPLFGRGIQAAVTAILT